MPQEKVVPDVVSYSAAVSDSWAMAACLFVVVAKEMMPNHTISYNTLITASYEKAKNWQAASYPQCFGDDVASSYRELCNHSEQCNRQLCQRWTVASSSATNY
eukprot:TRINITY_DN16749_c0_g1_i4.p1 TRINITY_DN16749_c0_g1~~TRINITY_DN16749_c0_g1_i4.p1  ORF type:complete len:103 (+),score=15.00 TRINITY_DN16749_c0_g1_i4:211-519(+)